MCEFIFVPFMVDSQLKYPHLYIFTFVLKLIKIFVAFSCFCFSVSPPFPATLSLFSLYIYLYVCGRIEHLVLWGNGSADDEGRPRMYIQSPATCSHRPGGESSSVGGNPSWPALLLLHNLCGSRARDVVSPSNCLHNWWLQVFQICSRGYLINPGYLILCICCKHFSSSYRLLLPLWRRLMTAT